MDFATYEYINREISSEMFYSLMSILHERIPLSKNFYKIRKKYRSSINNFINSAESSPVRIIASPNMVKGLSLTRTTTTSWPESPKFP